MQQYSVKGQIIMRDIRASRKCSQATFEQLQPVPLEINSASVDPQTQSLLFTLPPEVRDMILFHACGDYEVHCKPVGTGDRRVGVRFRFQDGLAVDDPKRTPGYIPGILERNEGFFPSRVWCTYRPLPKSELSILKYLQVCRRSYLETHNHIFAKNTFHLHDLWSVVDLANTLPQGMVNQIRKLHLTLDYGSQRRLFDCSAANAMWRNVWSQFPTDFAGLRRIEILLKVRFVQQFLKFTRFTSMIDALSALPLETVGFRCTVYTPNVGSMEKIAADAILAQELERRIETRCLRKSDELQG